MSNNEGNASSVESKESYNRLNTDLTGNDQNALGSGSAME